MLYKVIRIIFLLSTTLIMPKAAAFESCNLFDTTQKSYTETFYNGKMDVTMSKGKTFKGRPVSFTLANGVLHCDFPKMGKMPGKILINLPIQMQEGGKITASQDSKAGVIKMPLGLNLKLKLASLKYAKLIDNHLSFNLVVYAHFMGSKIPTTIYFSGDEVAP